MDHNTDFTGVFQRSGVYGLIADLEKYSNFEKNLRVKAFKLLQAARTIAKRSPDRRLKYLPSIAFDLSRHESIYRMSALLYIELDSMEKAIECLSYLHYYYQNNDNAPHAHYALIKDKLVEHYGDISAVDTLIAKHEDYYKEQAILYNLKEYVDILPTDDVEEQLSYFKKLFLRYDVETVIASINNDVRFNDRQKAVVLIRASRAIGTIAEEGPSIESVFAEEAMKMDTSDTVINNIYQAYLRAGDLNKVQQLKSRYSHIA
ncbi:hypothetical protein ACTXJF_10460 [Psychrobacter alimentarius]|uniref:hypothetical protein n=1 Tax=Psychrobacter alimentarius TaxID=261164 RepID=UPI003FD5A8E7